MTRKNPNDKRLDKDIRTLSRSMKTNLDVKRIMSSLSRKRWRTLVYVNCTISITASEHCIVYFSSCQKIQLLGHGKGGPAFIPLIAIIVLVPKGFVGGYELPLLVLSISASLILTGPGKVSIEWDVLKQEIFPRGKLIIMRNKRRNLQFRD